MKALKNISIVALSFLICTLFSFAVNARGWQTDGYDWYYQDANDSNLYDTIQSSNGKKYYLGDDGKMVRDYLLEYNDNIYYFNDEGEMVVDTWVAVDPYQVADPILNGPTVYLYYFGSNGKAYKAKEDVVKKVIDGKRYMFDSQGRMLSGWINESGEMWNYVDYESDPFDGFCYYGGDETDGVLREGWLAYEDGSVNDKYYERETIWLYFSPVTYKKVCSEEIDGYEERKINGRSYAFDDKGVMLMGWEVEPATRWYADEDDSDQSMVGALVKKRWNFVVPTRKMNAEDYENDTYRWVYSEANGNITKNTMKKINGYYYAFDKYGLMKDGLVIMKMGTHEFVDRIDLEATEGKDFLIDRKYQSKEDTVVRTFDNTKHVLYYFNTDDTTNMFGSRKTGTVTIAFADKDYVFASDTNGALNGVKNKKYYQEGFLLGADPLLTYGIVLDGYTTVKNGSSPQREAKYIGGTSATANRGNEYYISQKNDAYTTEWPHLIVVDKNGKKPAKKTTAKKDKDNNYWIMTDNSTFRKVVTVPVKYSRGVWYFRSDFYNAHTYKTKQTWIPFGEKDANGYTVVLERGEGQYELYLLEQYALNFKWID